MKICIDEFTKTMFVLTSQLNLLKFTNKTPENIANLSFVDSASIGEFEPDTSRLVDIQFVQELQAVVVVFASGSMYLYKIDSNEIEEVGTITDGIIAASWSPN